LRQEAQASSFGVNAEVTEVALDLGDNSVSYASVDVFEGQETESVIALVQQATFLHFTFGVSSGEDIQTIVRDVTNTLIQNEGSGEGEFNEDGTSSGGLWDKFPAADDEAVAGLFPDDQMLCPVSGSTPEAPVPAVVRLPRWDSR
jgi:hypothetical protein